ncbi:iron complex transport system substrate-binding protein [Williamsia limnetica]|uniref:Iron complex transport system substrate-binding protein n=1 Tax=Williamsia limnetica TaxID=882452 RepID=A0A318RTV9_WILLI|nr:ABC transporter substrate-binding protein [Williamsia limnetica]PYE19527.1 iron complex transport system substrate-binding protein [Williamsia limnetica]
MFSTRRGPGRTVAAIIVAGLFALAGCSSSSDDTASASEANDGTFPVVVEHSMGETTVPQRPERIVALGAGTAGEILYALGVEPVGLETFPGFGAANEDGVQSWVEPLLDTNVTTLLPSGAKGIEKVAALDPDLILLTYGELDEATYKQLSQIAPTIASPQGQWELDWRLELETIAKAIGMTDEAVALEAELTSGIKQVKADHPELDGVNYTFVEVHDAGLWPYLTADPRNQLIQELGLVSSPGVVALDKSTDGAFIGDISLERAGEIDADVIIAYPSTGDAQSLYSVPVFKDLSAVRRGSVAFYGQEQDIVFLASLQPSPLTIPISLERVATDVSAALTSGSPK